MKGKGLDREEKPRRKTLRWLCAHLSRELKCITLLLSIFGQFIFPCVSLSGLPVLSWSITRFMMRIRRRSIWIQVSESGMISILSPASSPVAWAIVKSTFDNKPFPNYCFKTNSCEKPFFHNSLSGNTFSYEWFCIKSSFDTETKATWKWLVNQWGGAQGIMGKTVLGPIDQRKVYNQHKATFSDPDNKSIYQW